MPVLNRQFPEGSTLTADYKGVHYVLRHHPELNGGMFIIEEPEDYPRKKEWFSLSRAGKDITQAETNGWKFWTLVEDKKLSKKKPFQTGNGRAHAHRPAVAPVEPTPIKAPRTKKAPIVITEATSTETTVKKPRATKTADRVIAEGVAEIVKAAVKRAPRATKSKETVNLKILPNQSTASEGMTKVFCSACMSAFEIVKGSRVEDATCLSGHAFKLPDVLAPEGIEIPKED